MNIVQLKQQVNAERQDAIAKIVSIQPAKADSVVTILDIYETTNDLTAEGALRIIKELLGLGDQPVIPSSTLLRQARKETREAA